MRTVLLAFFLLPIILLEGCGDRENDKEKSVRPSTKLGKTMGAEHVPTISKKLFCWVHTSAHDYYLPVPTISKKLFCWVHTSAHDYYLPAEKAEAARKLLTFLLSDRGQQVPPIKNEARNYAFFQEKEDGPCLFDFSVDGQQVQVSVSEKLVKSFLGDERTLLRLREFFGAVRKDVATITENLDNASKDVRIAAVQALGSEKDLVSIMPKLVKKLNDPALEVRLCVAEAILQVDKGNKEATLTVLSLMKNPDKDIREHASYVLASATRLQAKIVVRPLIQILKQRSSGISASVIKALGNIGVEARGALPELIASIQDPAWRIRREACIAIGKINPTKEMVPLLCRSLGDQEWQVKKAAAFALSRCGSVAQAAVPELSKLLAERNLELRKAAAEAILRIDPANQEAKRVVGELERNNPRQGLKPEAKMGNEKAVDKDDKRK